MQGEVDLRAHGAKKGGGREKKLFVPLGQAKLLRDQGSCSNKLLGDALPCASVLLHLACRVLVHSLGSLVLRSSSLAFPPSLKARRNVRYDQLC